MQQSPILFGAASTLPKTETEGGGLGANPLSKTTAGTETSEVDGSSLSFDLLFQDANAEQLTLANGAQLEADAATSPLLDGAALPLSLASEQSPSNSPYSQSSLPLLPIREGEFGQIPALQQQNVGEGLPLLSDGVSTSEQINQGLESIGSLVVDGADSIASEGNGAFESLLGNGQTAGASAQSTSASIGAGTVLRPDSLESGTNLTPGSNGTSPLAGLGLEANAASNSGGLSDAEQSQVAGFSSNAEQADVNRNRALDSLSALNGVSANPNSSVESSGAAAQLVSPALSAQQSNRSASQSTIQETAGAVTLNTLDDGYSNSSVNQSRLFASLSAASNPGQALLSDADQSFQTLVEQASSSVTEVTPDSTDEALTKAEQAVRAGELQSKNLNPSVKPYSTSVQTQVGDPQWGNEINEKIAWLSTRNIQSAQIHLNPAELGPIDVRVSFQNDQAVVNFNAQNPNVRDLLEANVQRLRDMLDANGVENAQVDVDLGSSEQGGGQFASRDQGAGQSYGSRSSDTAGDLADSTQETVESVSSVEDFNLVDDYV